MVKKGVRHVAKSADQFRFETTQNTYQPTVERHMIVNSSFRVRIR